MTVFRPVSKSTKVSAGQRAIHSSSRGTSVPGCSRSFQQDHERLFLDLHANAAFAQFVRLWIKLECGEAVLPRVPNGLRALQ
jgi:hypothetical protein